MCVFIYVFSELAHRFFLIFCMKLGDHKWRKVTEPDFSEKFWFSQNFGKSAKIGLKMWFFMFILKFCPLMCIFFWLKSFRITFFTILRKPHVRENSGSRNMAQKALGQSDCSIFQIWISQEWFDRLSWFFVQCSKTIRGIQWRYSWWLMSPGLAQACPNLPKFYRFCLWAF